MMAIIPLDCNSILGLRWLHCVVCVILTLVAFKCNKIFSLKTAIWLSLSLAANRQKKKGIGVFTWISLIFSSACCATVAFCFWISAARCICKQSQEHLALGGGSDTTLVVIETCLVVTAGFLVVVNGSVVVAEAFVLGDSLVAVGRKDWVVWRYLLVVPFTKDSLAGEDNSLLEAATESVVRGIVFLNVVLGFGEA